ncbi:MAG: acyl-CoA thioesterase [Hydrogenovibrio sp.]|nr:acyl-CoA thioesterase [Hydrogenovibrio sp.]
MKCVEWSHPDPFIEGHRVTEPEIDFLEHVNNKVYLEWMEKIAWEHSLSVGIDHQRQQALGKIMVVKQHLLNYHAGCYLGDQLLIGTWLGEQIGCCQRKRHYEIFRQSDGKRIFSGHTVWACMNLKTHRACRIPQAFITPYETAAGYPI